MAMNLILLVLVVVVVVGEQDQAGKAKIWPPGCSCSHLTHGCRPGPPAPQGQARTLPFSSWCGQSSLGTAPATLPCRRLGIAAAYIVGVLGRPSPISAGLEVSAPAASLLSRHPCTGSSEQDWSQALEPYKWQQEEDSFLGRRGVPCRAQTSETRRPKWEILVPPPGLTRATQRQTGMYFLLSELQKSSGLSQRG